MSQRLDYLIGRIRMLDLPSGGMLVPISGGSDSAFCFWLCNEALPGKVLGIFVGRPFSLRQGDWFGQIGRIVENEVSSYDINDEITRWAMFQNVTMRGKLALIGTRNKTEDVLGTYSLASRVATILPIVSFWKSEILDLCRQVGVPDEIVSSSLRADPACGRPQELAEIPIEDIDLFLKVKVADLPQSELFKLGSQKIEYLEKIYEYNSFKKDLPVRL
jgi:NH3-dependent NAD+ synthetase